MLRKSKTKEYDSDLWLKGGHFGHLRKDHHSYGNKLQSPQQTVAIDLLLFLHNLSLSLSQWEDFLSLKPKSTTNPSPPSQKKQRNNTTSLSLSLSLGFNVLSLSIMAQLDQNLCRIEEKNKKEKKRKDGKIGEKERYVSSNVLQPLLFHTRIFPQMPFLLHYFLPNPYGLFGLLTFSMSFRNKDDYIHRHNPSSLSLSTFSLFNYNPPFVSLALPPLLSLFSIPNLIHVLGLWVVSCMLYFQVLLMDSHPLSLTSFFPGVWSGINLHFLLLGMQVWGRRWRGWVLWLLVNLVPLTRKLGLVSSIKVYCRISWNYKRWGFLFSLLFFGFICMFFFHFFHWRSRVSNFVLVD